MYGKKRNGCGFTLIELLVVIAIIALLLSIIVPSLKRVKEQAMEVVCKAHLHQWGLIFSMYTDEHDSKFMPGWEEDTVTAQYTWVYALKDYYQDESIRLCPRANRTEMEGGNTPWAAWHLTYTGSPFIGSYIENETGSYGINWWVNDNDSDGGGMYPSENKWRKLPGTNTSAIPVLSDAIFILFRPDDDDQPPLFDEGDFYWEAGEEMKRICHDRHNGGINLVFMDWSARNVGLKELWELKWHRNWVTRTDIDWPDWMNDL